MSDNERKIAEITKAIWSETTMKAAKRLNMSEHTLRRFCRSHGIKTPPRGFWARVYGGFSPHPQGVPVV